MNDQATRASRGSRLKATIVLEDGGVGYYLFPLATASCFRKHQGYAKSPFPMLTKKGELTHYSAVPSQAECGIL